MFRTVVLLLLCCLSIACQGLKHGVNNDITQIREELRKQGMVRLRLSERAVFAEGPVAFQAGVSAKDVTHIRVKEKIIFDNVRLNLGAGYHGQFGLFIAPKPGIYIFSVTILSNVNLDLEVMLMKNEVEIGGAYGDAVGETNGFDRGSVTVVLQLDIGDEVYVEKVFPDDTSLRGNNQSNFIDCLVFELESLTNQQACC